MNEPAESRDLKELHRPSAIRRRLGERRRHSHLGDAVLGGVDGCVTTFAVVAGAAGGGLPDAAIVVLGCANLLADGFSMAAGNYLSVKSRREELLKARREEESHIARIPRGEREEIRQIFRRKGFNGAVLEKIVAVITRDEALWVETMLTEERGLQTEERRPLLAGLATFGAFAAAGSMPLLPFLLPAFPADAELAASAAITAVAFLAIGLMKGLVLRAPLLRSGLETLGVGGAAAGLAFAAGRVIRGLYGG
ncbi:MAG: VIT1/CCC1 transporter family protein [Elusimicrobia bacterium]|nr:VIT1/CCC1 transporter family protein [Elusimicrobiota bacterium]